MNTLIDDLVLYILNKDLTGIRILDTIIADKRKEKRLLTKEELAIWKKEARLLKKAA